MKEDVSSEFTLSRETAVKRITDCLGPTDIVVGTTGMLSRELYEYRFVLKFENEYVLCGYSYVGIVYVTIRH